MAILFMIISTLNLLDGVFTFIGLHYSLIEEMNPIMNWLWEYHPMMFLFVKVSLSLVVVIIGISLGKQELVFKHWKLVLFPVLVIYFVILLLHFRWVFLHVF